MAGLLCWRSGLLPDPACVRDRFPLRLGVRQQKEWIWGNNIWLYAPSEVRWHLYNLTNILPASQFIRSQLYISLDFFLMHSNFLLWLKSILCFVNIMHYLADYNDYNFSLEEK